jgi:WD repeat-containing protein 19
LSISSENRVVNIWDRNGELFKEIDLEGNCTGLDWSKDGNLLAVIHSKNSDVIIWNSSRETTSRLDTGEKAALTFLKWSAIGMTLAIGTAKGTLVLYNHTTSRKIPVYSKHGNKPITCGAWSSENQLCLGGGDKTCTISSDGGSTLQQLPLHHDPSDIAFHESGPDANGDTETTVSILLQRKTLYLWSSSDPDNPIELEFQAKYGNIVAYEWFGDKKVLIGFSSGHFIIVSTVMDHIGQELFQSKNHRTRLNHICISEALNKAASCGDDQVKIHDLTDPSDMCVMCYVPCAMCRVLCAERRVSHTALPPPSLNTVLSPPTDQPINRSADPAVASLRPCTVAVLAAFYRCCCCCCVCRWLSSLSSTFAPPLLLSAYRWLSSPS